jgi:hypothetical protein
MGDRTEHQAFYIDELIFRRCKEHEKLDPFNSISLADVSVNRAGTDANFFCHRDDTLFNTNPENGKGEVIQNEVVCDLIIKELIDSQYFKILEFEKKLEDGSTTKDVCSILLKHKPDKCNYAHCAFVFCYNGVEISTFEIYKQTLKKNNPLKTLCKNELAKLIVKEEIRINFED